MISIREQVIFCDTDCGGVVSNIAYLRFVEKARCRLFGELGMGLTEMNETQCFPTVVRTEVDYLKPARLGDEIEISAKIESVKKVRIFCEFALQVSREGSSFDSAFARQTVVLLQMPDGKPVRPPENWPTIN